MTTTPSTIDPCNRVLPQFYSHASCYCISKQALLIKPHPSPLAPNHHLFQWSPTQAQSSSPKDSPLLKQNPTSVPSQTPGSSQLSSTLCHGPAHLNEGPLTHSVFLVSSIHPLAWPCSSPARDPRAAPCPQPFWPPHQLLPGQHFQQPREHEAVPEVCVEVPDVAGDTGEVRGHPLGEGFLLHGLPFI